MNKSLSNEDVGGSTFHREGLVLADVLANRVTLHYFQKFLEQEYSEENLLFYLEVERFKTLKLRAAIEAKAVYLHRHFINPDTASTPVNLTQDVVDEIQRRLAPLLLAHNHAEDEQNNDHDQTQVGGLLTIFDAASEGKDNHLHELKMITIMVQKKRKTDFSPDFFFFSFPFSFRGTRDFGA